MSLNAFVTLVTTDSYVAGAIVAIKSLLEAEGRDQPANPFETVCLVTPATVSVESIKALRRNFSLVVGVEELRSGSQKQLQLLGRQDLSSTLTKLQLFRLVQFRKIIFLDADTLVLQPLSHLFSLDAPFSAAPDSGWPDCFNSGMFVASPSADTFDKLVQMATERGSWDGGDQGLLNDFFPDWNRLSFTYNVTPSAYYTYAPAYRRHGQNIKVVHFIGSHKPWHEAGPSRQIPSTSETSGASDYASLLNRWFNVYQRYFGSSSPQSSASTFSFPKLQATWDTPAGRTTPYIPPSLEDLKRTFQGVYAGQSVSASSRQPDLQRQTFSISGSDIEGHYVSMPLKPGRPDLMGNLVFIPQTASPPNPARVPSPPSVTQPRPAAASRVPSPPRAPSPVQTEKDQGGQWSPPQVSWDPARSEPPKNDGPQMQGGWDQQFDNVWDGPRSAAQRTFFDAPSSYGRIPKITHQNYEQVTRSHSPDVSKIRPVFPWESNASAPRAGRVFPREHPSQVPARQQQLQQQQAPQQAPSQPTQKSTPPPPQSVDLSNLTSHYTNAWDDVPAIRRKYSEARHSRSSSTSNPSQGYSASGPSQSHTRSGSTATSSRSIPGPGRATGQNNGGSPKKTTEGYETGGEASSRDGDDEDEDDEEEENDHFDANQYSRSSVSRPSSTAPKRGQPVRSPSAPKVTLSSSRTLPPPSYNGASRPTAVQRTSSTNVLANLSPSAAAVQQYRNQRLQPSSRTSSSETVTLSSPSAPSSGLPDTSSGAYQSNRVSRVFDRRTDTDHIKKEGLEALHRFVRSMEAKGAALNGEQESNGNSSGNGNGHGRPAQAGMAGRSSGSDSSKQHRAA